jgi:hypothetical protein
MKHSPLLLCAALLLTAFGPPASAAEVNATLGTDPTQLAGADPLGRVLLYTPDELNPGSSVSHWDVSATPDLLMEPSASPQVPVGEVDLTLPAFREMGWPAGTSNVTLRVSDEEGEGFNDPTEVDEVSGNPGGTTLGGQRRAAMQWAADIWASYLGSDVEINIATGFSELDCDEDEGTAVLAQAGPDFRFFDFPNAPKAATWYAGALAESLAGENLSSTVEGADPDDSDLSLFFNTSIDEGCLSPTYRFYYGLDGNTPPGQIAFAMIALHELAHGFGFLSFINPATGGISVPPNSGIPRMPDIYSTFMYDLDLELHWDVMTGLERMGSATNNRRVVWDGPQTTDEAADLLDAAQTLRINSPGDIAGSYQIQPAFFGPEIGNPDVSGNLVVAVDGTNQPNLVCESVANAAEVAGRIALIDRGECFFTVKVKNAQEAGAIAVLIVNNEDQGLPPMGGSDATITIPSAGITKADGELLKQALEAPGTTAPQPLRPTGRLVPTGG